MSANRNRRGRRAYLKHVSSRHDPQPDSAMKHAIGLGRDINPVNALPHRAIQWLDKNKHTPTMTQPMIERTESWRQTIKPQRSEYHVKLVDTPLQLVSMYFTTFNEYGCFWFKRLDRISGIELESMSVGSKQKAMELFRLNRIPWK